MKRISRLLKNASKLLALCMLANIAQSCATRQGDTSGATQGATVTATTADGRSDDRGDRAEALRAAVRAHHAAHPAMRLQDYYKTFFQDRFGPSHLIEDTLSVIGWLDRELATADTGALLFEPTGLGGRYVRVFCRAVDDGLVGARELAMAFVSSANSVTPLEGRWRDEWSAIEEALRDEGLLPEGYADDSASLARMLAEHGDHAVSHSQAYRDAYAPHYRIVSRAIFDSLFLPRFQADKTLIVFTTDTTAAKQALRAMKATVLYDYRTLGGLAVRVPDSLSTRWAADRLERVPGTTGVMADRTLELDRAE